MFKNKINVPTETANAKIELFLKNHSLYLRKDGKNALPMQSIITFEKNNNKIGIIQVATLPIPIFPFGL